MKEDFHVKLPPRSHQGRHGMSDSSMIERVGLAIGIACKATGLRGEIWIAPEQQELARTVARAAIEAMREPTYAMCDGPRKFDLVDFRMDASDIWQSMIDAALSEAEPKG